VKYILRYFQDLFTFFNLKLPLIGLDKDYRCEKRHIIKELDFKLNKREKKWLELLVSQHDTARLSSDARDYLSNLLGKCGGNAATITSSYHTDDNEYDDVLNYNDGDD